VKAARLLIFLPWNKRPQNKVTRAHLFKFNLDQIQTSPNTNPHPNPIRNTNPHPIPIPNPNPNESTKSGLNGNY